MNRRLQLCSVVLHYTGSVLEVIMSILSHNILNSPFGLTNSMSSPEWLSQLALMNMTT